MNLEEAITLYRGNHDIKFKEPVTLNVILEHPIAIFSLCKILSECKDYGLDDTPSDVIEDLLIACEEYFN